MKKTLILGLIVAGSSLMATEPFSLRSTMPKKEAKNNSEFFSKTASRKNFDGLANITLKMNLTQLALKNLSFMGEYGFHPKMSVGLGFSYLLERPLPDLVFPSTEYFSTPTYKGRSITPEFRVYFGGDDEKPAPRGFYLAAYLRQSKYTMTQTVSYQETPSSRLYTAQGIHTIKGANGGLMIGYQWITESGFTIDWWISGGGYGGNAQHDGLSNGCSTIGISKAPPVEIMEQNFPILYRRYALHEGSGGAGQHRGGFGLDYEIQLLRGTARASFVMDHGRTGPQGAQGGQDGAVNRVEIHKGDQVIIPEHLSKAQDIPLAPGDRVRVRTPGGGGYGPANKRDPALVAQDLRLGRYDAAQAHQHWPAQSVCFDNAVEMVPPEGLEPPTP